MNWLRILLKNYKQNNFRRQFETEIKHACQYEMIEY